MRLPEYFPTGPCDKTMGLTLAVDEAAAATKEPQPYSKWDFEHFFFLHWATATDSSMV